MVNVMEASQAAGNRKAKTAGLQIAQGLLQTTAGALSFGGVTAFAGATLLLISFGVGIGSSIYNYFKKKHERIDVIDKFINMPKLYQDFTGGPGQRRTSLIKKYGSEKKIKEMIRKEVESRMGFPNDAKFHANIMQIYANGIYQGAFLKEDGTVLTGAERQHELTHNHAKWEERELFLRTIRSLGIKVVVPVNDEDPVPSVAGLFKKMME